MKAEKSAMVLWYHFFGMKRNPDIRDFLSSLEKAGLIACELDAAAPNSPGIVFFNKIDGSLCRFMREVSRSGRDRVLAVCLLGAALKEENIWRLMAGGASDVIEWEKNDRVKAGIAGRLQRWHEVDRIIESKEIKERLITHSPLCLMELRQVVEVARFSDAHVLITGESGTGKELVAALIHDLDQRRQKNEFVLLDCATLVPELSGSEFFGHERGAFTGATNPRDGVFALADGGTLFLDEVGELPAQLQSQLLRVIQEGDYKRVGGNTWYHTDFRLISATNKNLIQQVRNGLFRHDLFYRMATWIFKLPPLRERPEDILPLTHHFLAQSCPGRDPPKLTGPVRNYLLAREYPGNIRDLQQLVTRIGQRHLGKGPITVGDIPPEDRPAEVPGRTPWYDGSLEINIRRALTRGVGLKEIGRTAETIAVSLAVRDEDGNLQRAARKLKVTDRTLQLRRAAKKVAMQHRGAGEKTKDAKIK